MTAREEGFLLLTCPLGDPDRKALTVAQFRELAKRAAAMEKPLEDRDLAEEDLVNLGCNRTFAKRVLHLLSQKDQLAWYLEKCQQKQCFSITRLSPQYPRRIRQTLGLEAPGSLWAKGDSSCFDKPMIGLVGSRDLNRENRIFAESVGRQAALQGFTLVSGNARGADRTAQDACLEAGGSVISIVADELYNMPASDRIVYLSEDGFDLAFSSVRALSRNRLIHSLPSKVFVAQCTLGKGGTWQGSVKNLQRNWSSLFCFDDGSEAVAELSQMGAKPITNEELYDLESLDHNDISLF